ncbi:MAG TPA: hypothetical protein VG321_04350 [Solirubrobacteraceae bacterium]|nr:hypothetical protein [Solirubrobacteraceae bacterium]
MSRVPWPVRSVAAGAAGTAALSASYVLERRLRRTRQADYDDSLVPGGIVCSILHLHQVTGRFEYDAGLGLRWTYGSGFGLLHGWLRRRIQEPWASVGFGGVLLTMTFTMFPLLGHTPPPWRWPRGYVTSELLTHGAYVGTVALVDGLGSSG